MWERPCVAKGARSGPSFLWGQGANEKFSETSLVIEYGGLMYVVTARFLVATPDMTQVVRPLRATPGNAGPHQPAGVDTGR
ncbi:hypothetical protein D3C72_2188740 [compost metagenome]